MTTSSDDLLKRVRACQLCAGDLLRAPNPILQFHPQARVLIAGQAPGNRADLRGVPFDDPSGDRLRDWMGIDRVKFYDETRIAIVPMGFCFPGYDKSGGDKPPQARCESHWRAELMRQLEQIEVTLLVGRYAQSWHLGSACLSTLTDTVKNWRVYAKQNVFVLPHPSWRNTAWLKRNPWFVTDVVPEMQKRLHEALG